MLYNRNCCKNTEKKNLKLAIYFLIVKHNVSTEESIKHKYTVKKKKKKRKPMNLSPKVRKKYSTFDGHYVTVPDGITLHIPQR